jgi:DNA invertase Pin-like site-specific DNA recombinase
MSIIGYARVSTADQNTAMQTDALKAAKCEKIFVENGSGGDRKRPMLAKCLSFIREGDTLVVWKLDRLARSTAHLYEIMELCTEKKVMFRSLNDSIDTSTAAGKCMFGMLCVFAEFERNIIRERTMAGLAAARARGRKGGRPRKVVEALPAA